jgi:two-component system, chemotaxis family, protein-glutamate methylesterase/glutaminase
MLEPAAPHRDIVVLGGSAGGISALCELVGTLPPDLPAAVFVVIHMGMGTTSRLPEVLSRRGPLRATHAIHGEEITPGHIYVAPPDMHLVVRPGYVHVVRGPKENGQRPSVDTLFRSAAVVYGPRVIGAVLSGYLDCGTSGLLSIKARGGVSVVQDPNDAEVPDMPASALKHAPIDHVAKLSAIGSQIAALVRKPAGDWPGQLPSTLREFEGEELGIPVEIVCPSCQGSLTETQLGGFRLYRCHVGHSFSLASMVDEQAQALEHALWAAARALEETSALAGRMANASIGNIKQKFEEKQRSQKQQADLIRRMLEHGTMHESDLPPSGEIDTARASRPD